LAETIFPSHDTQMLGYDTMLGRFELVFAQFLNIEELPEKE